ncbi:hypothetical protein BOTBODRAFT_130344 [Botryobasidium botryosum FD-172 SS1]|uniref:Uncharacterized protein n=1 Tax=Botryobasidium botryosum (strain FD-172 SS1) TaxID=930990 RepID=A0A067MW45_BOTB1|nr:hypothetical protein BOTBODRAFT_130344 [Botryobasidium botryosum FD-172 SS1]
MILVALLFPLLLLVTRIFAIPIAERNGVAFIPPASNGGSQLDESAGLGEPLNVIISGLSTPSVLTNEGIEDYARSFGFSTECLGFHIGDKQKSNLGDGQGYQDEIAVIRQDFGDSTLGTCLESLTGGNHFRFWRQSTTGAYFLAASKEEPVSRNHNIVPNGYDLGRDALVNAAIGKTSYNGVDYSTTVEWLTGLLTPGSEGINHGIAIDGRVALLTVTAS